VADVFHSWAKDDLEKAGAIAAAIQEAGFSVWWDYDLNPGQSFNEVIGKKLHNAKVVIVLWSNKSVASAWVREEASAGHQRAVLIPVLIEQVVPPLGFRMLHQVHLSEWSGDRTENEWRRLIAAIERLVGRSALAKVSKEPRPAGRPDSKQTETRSPQSLPPEIPGEEVHVDPTRSFRMPKGASRTSLFIAHASADKPRLRAILKVLLDTGFPLWLDKPHQIGLTIEYEKRIGRIQMGADWQASIANAVKKSRAVLAFWSNDAINGKREQFHYEVFQGLAQQKLNQCKLDPIPEDKIGKPYTIMQITDLSDFGPEAFHPELDILMADIAQKHRPRLF
jgi:hypothetical protein